MTDYQIQTASIVNVTITSSVNSFGTEKRFGKDLTIIELKGKCEVLTGSKSGNMKLELYDKNDKLLAHLDNDAAMLGSYPCDDGCRIHIVDNTIKAGEFEDVSQVEKFELTEEEYLKRPDSVRAYKERMKLGRFAEISPEEKKRQEEEKEQKEKEEKERADSMKIGDRCEVTVPKQPTRRGEVLYVGTTEFQPGLWVGVKYDEPLGKNDGSVKGKRYFTCPPKYGGFVKPGQVTVGDFPEEGMDFSDDDEM
ncbi:unnamed protein product [Owenia fusiformis]|uniref:Uncharacterized protein n=1 Tax=Owenia fusiformis TaxID=6347 RepID=A0A8J1XX05_OWEFU|nr:unnamed protein product [Owenia fusiformis]